MVTIYDMVAGSPAEYRDSNVGTTSLLRGAGIALTHSGAHYIGLNGAATNVWLHAYTSGSGLLGFMTAGAAGVGQTKNYFFTDQTSYCSAAVYRGWGSSIDSASTVKTAALQPLPGIHQWALHINGATWTLYRAGVQVLQHTYATADSCLKMVVQGSGPVAHVYTANEYIPEAFVEVLQPNGNGALSEFVGSDGNSTDNYLLIDEATPSATDYVGTGATGKTDLYTLTDTSAGVSQVFAVKPHIYAMNSDVGTAPDLNILQREAGGTTRTTATDPISTATMAYTPQPVDNTKPSGGAWTKAVVDGLQIGLGT